MKAGKAGFTLIELMVVIVIFAILMGLAVYGMWGMRSNLSYRQGTDMAVGVLKTARAKAIRGETRAEVIFQRNAPPNNPSSYTIQWWDVVNRPPHWVIEGTGTFPTDVEYVPVGAGQDIFEFLADGSASIIPNPGNAHIQTLPSARRPYNQAIQVLQSTGLARIIP